MWWLHDGGGLALLVPHLLTLNGSYYEDAELRVFTVSTSDDEHVLEKERENFVALLAAFRINATVTIIGSFTRDPDPST